jgi:hypothetical protein
MDRLSIYRGMAGEVVVGFLRPGTMLTSIPVIGAFILSMLIIAFVPGLGGVVGAILMMFVSAWIVGRFVQPAQDGYLDEGFFSAHLPRGAARRYALRYLAAIILSGTPLFVGALYLAFRTMGDSLGGLMGMGGMGGMGSVMGAGLAGALIVALIVLIMLDLFLAYLMAAWTDSYSDLIGLRPWAYLWQRRADVVMFIVAGVGGLLAFWMIYFVPILFVIGIISLMSDEAAIAVAGWAMALPMALSPVLLGRLAGSFMAGEGEFDPSERPVGDLSPEAEAALAAARSGADPAVVAAAAAAAEAASENPEPAPSATTTQGAADTTTGSTTTSTTAASTTRTSVTVSAFSKDHVAVAVQSVGAMSDEQVGPAREIAQTAFQNDPHDLAASVRFGLLSLREGRSDNAVRALRLVISELVAERSGAAAVELYQSLGKNRTRLGLDKSTLEGLAKILKLQEKFLDAGWCLYAAWIASNPQNAQNQLTLIGLEAVEKEAWEDVQRIFSFLLQKHPETTFKDKATEALAKAEKELEFKKKMKR